MVWLLCQRCASPPSLLCADVVDPELLTSNSNLLHRSREDHDALLASGHRRCRNGNIHAAYGIWRCRNISSEYLTAIDRDVFGASQVEEFEPDFVRCKSNVTEVEL